MTKHIPGLEKRKRKYDLKLKEFVNDDSLFDIEHDVYFNDAAFKKLVLDKLGSYKEAYEHGAGKELAERNKNGKKLPPCMASVASSSRFCCFSLKDSDLSVFGIKNKNNPISFEEKLPIFDNGHGTPPHMDAYYEDDSDCYFFECKCHEQFDSHKIELSPAYFREDRIVTKIDSCYFKNPSANGYFNICPRAFGLSDNPRFDIKQFLTHLMGIKKKMVTKPNKKAHLIYFYFIPCEIKDDKEINEVIERLILEIKTVFNHKFFKEHAKEIEFSLFIMHSKVVETADYSNVYKVSTTEE